MAYVRDAEKLSRMRVRRRNRDMLSEVRDAEETSVLENARSR